jgi:hypothetical protein
VRTPFLSGLQSAFTCQHGLGNNHTVTFCRQPKHITLATLLVSKMSSQLGAGSVTVS